MSYTVTDDPTTDPQDPKKPKPYVVTDDSTATPAASSAQDAPYKVTDDSATGDIDLRGSAASGGTPTTGRVVTAPTALPPDHPAAPGGVSGMFDRYVTQPINHAVDAANQWRDAFVPQNVGAVAQPINRQTITEQAQAAKAAGARLISGAASADVSGTPGAQILPAAGGGAGTTTAAAMDASKTMASIQTSADQAGQFSPQRWMDIAKRGMELGSALHAQGKHDEAQDVLQKAYNAQLLSMGAKQADTPSAIALSNLLGIVKDPFAQQRKNMAEIRANPDLTFTPGEQQSMLGRNVAVGTDRGFDVGKDVLAPLAGQAPLFELGGFAGRGAAGIAGAAAERAGYDGIGSVLGRAAQLDEGAIAAGPAAPMRTAALARTRLEEEVASLRQQLPHMVERGATQGQVVGAISTYRQARQQGATPEQALAAAAEGAGLQVPMGVAAELGLGIAGRVAGVGYDPIGRAWTDVRDRVRGTTPEEAVTSAMPAPTPLVDAARAQEGKLPTSDMMPGIHRDIAQSLEEILGQKKAATQRNYEDIFAHPNDAQRPAGPDFWNNLSPEEHPMAVPGDRPLGPEPEPQLVERPNVIGGRGQNDAPPSEPLPTHVEAAMRRLGIEPAIRPSDEADAHFRMRRAAMDADEHGRMAAEEAQKALSDPNLRLEMAAQARPGEQQGPRTLAETLAETKDRVAAGEPLAVEYHDAINNYVDAAAAVKDAGDGGPNTRSQIALARARSALDVARTKYGKQIGASAVLALAANNSDLDDEEKKMVGLGGLAILGTDVVKLDEAHPLMQNVPFVSRLRTAIESLPKKWEQPVPAADWIGKLKGTATFKKDELALILPKLEEAQRNKVKLSRDDVRAIMKEQLPEIQRVNLGSGYVDPSVVRADGEHGDPDSIIPIDDLGAHMHPNELQEQIDHRQAAIDIIEQRIEEETESSQQDMDSAEHDMNRRYRDVQETAEEHGYDHDVLDPAFDYLREHVESEHVPRNAIDKAMEAIQDGLYERAVSDPEEALTENGYTIEEVPEEPPEPKRQVEVIHNGTGTHSMAVRGPDVNGEMKHRTPLGDGRFRDRWAMGTARPEEEYVARAREIYGDSAEKIHVVDNAEEIANHEPDPDNSQWVVRDSSGKEIAKDYDRDTAMSEAVSEAGLGANIDQAYQEIRDGLDRYADELANYQARESEHYWRTEGEAFEQEQSEIEQYRTEMSQIEDMQTEAHDRMDDFAATLPQGQQAIGAGDGQAEPGGERPAGEPVAVVPAPEEPEQNIIPQVHGKPEYSSYQRIGGGLNYREMLSVWSNNPGDPYTSGHYRSYANTVGHVRAEDHVIRVVPGISDGPVQFREGEPEAVRTTKSHIIEKQKQRDKILGEMSALVREYEALPEADQAQAHGLASKYQKLNQQVNDLGLRIDELTDKAMRLLDVHSTPKEVAVMIESQSDWSQDASKYGVKEPPKPPPTEEELAPLRATAARADRNYSEAYTRFTDAQEAHRQWEERANEHIFVPDMKARFAQAIAAAKDGAPEGDPAWSMVDMLPSASEILNPAWQGEWEVLRRIVDPETRDVLDQLRRVREESDIRSADLNTYRTQQLEAAQALRAALNPEDTYSAKVPPSPFIDSGTVVSLNAARFLLDSAERGRSDIAWSDSANRIKNAHLPMQAALLNYDELTPSAMTRLLGGLGFRNVTIDKIYIKGEGHWHIELTPEMRKAIKRTGLPILGVMALAAAPEKADAQVPGQPSVSDLYATAVGGIAAGAALMYLAQNRKVRRIVKENRELERALMLDDLSGLANKKAFLRARESVDGDEKFHWVVFDGDRFKKLNDVHGHAEGDKAIQHFGKTVMDVAKKLDIPMRGFRFGGDEIAFAAPQEHAAEFQRRVEQASRYTVGDVTTKLTGGHGPTFDVADAMLNAAKEANRTADPTLRRRDDGPSRGGATLYANPVGPAMRELAKYPSAVTLAAVGALATQSDNKDIKATGVPLMALAAMSAVGSRRITAGKDALADRLLTTLRKSDEGTSVARFFNPEALLHPEVRDAIKEFERARAKGQARASELSGKAQALGPSGDRAVSDVIENEQWEDVSAMDPKDMTAVLTFAASLESEYSKLALEKVNSGVLDAGQLLPGYAGPRRYAHYEAADVLADDARTPGGGGSARIGSQKSRTLDEPIRDAQRALATAQAAGDPKAISDAQDALDEAHAVQMSQRTERGEIRESSYRAAQGIEKGYADVAAAKLFEQLRAQPGVAHPDWVAAVDDLATAKKMRAAAATPADRKTADDLIRDAKVAIDEVTRKYQQKNGDWTSLPDTPGLGMLRGAVVQKDVANSLNGFGQKNFYLKALRAWKNVKTIFNPGTHAANIISNITVAHMEGVPMWEQPILLKRAAKEMREYGPVARALTEDGQFMQSDVQDRSVGVTGRQMKSERGLTQLLGTTRPETADVLRKQGITEERASSADQKRMMRFVMGGAALGFAKEYDDEEPGSSSAVGVGAGAAIGALAGKYGGRMADMYGREDNIFRVAIAMKHLASGKSLDQAVADVRGFRNYRTRSPAVQMLRSTISPFILYPMTELPRFTAQVVDHPWRYMALIALWGGLNEYSKQQVGAVPDADVPPGQRRRAGYALPGFTQLPMKNDRGERGAVDISRWTPMSAITSAAPPGTVPASFDEKTPDIFRPGGPVVDLGAKLSNVDAFTQKPLFRPDHPVHENIAHALNDVAGEMLPSALDIHATNITRDIKNRDPDKLKNDALGPTGLRPRFIRPGQNAQNATYELQTSLAEMKHSLVQDLTANKNSAQTATIQDRYMRRVRQAIANYRDRLGVEPPADLVRQALTPDQPQ